MEVMAIEKDITPNNFSEWMNWTKKLHESMMDT